MKKKSFFLSLLVLAIIGWVGIKMFIIPRDYRRDSRHFFCTDNGHCVTMWRTRNGICYIIPGKYYGSSPPNSESYITSPFKKSLDIIWPKKSNNIIVKLEDEKSQIIHETINGIKIINYNVNKKYNDSIFIYSDGRYDRYKKEVDIIYLDIKEEYADGSRVITEIK